MNGGFEHSHLPGLLDDPHIQIQSDHLPTLPDVHIAPLRNPAPSRHGNAPLPLEPLADNTLILKKQTNENVPTQFGSKHGKTSPHVRPRVILQRRDLSKTNLAISELVEPSKEQTFDNGPLPSFVSLAVVERSPTISSQTYRLRTDFKRQRLDTDAGIDAKEDYRHLPLPAQKDEAASARPLPLLPAMVAGLNEPPRSAGLLPSMELEKLSVNAMVPPTNGETQLAKARRDKKTAGRPPEMMLNSPDLDFAALPEPESASIMDVDPPGTTTATEAMSSNKLDCDQKRSRRQPRKWSEQETLDLLSGIEHHGEGKWIQILRDPSYTFHSRMAMDLKDRYRNINPNQAHGGGDKSKLDVKPRHTKSGSGRTEEADVKARDDADLDESSLKATGKRKSRKRRRWTAYEDESLMRGLTKHGFGWSAMQTDKEIGLSHRRATDIRDRVRTKFPDAYRFAEPAPVRAEGGKSGKQVASQQGSANQEKTSDNDQGMPGERREKRHDATDLGENDAKKQQHLPHKPPGQTPTERTVPAATGNTDGSQESSKASFTLPPLPPIVSEDGAWNWDGGALGVGASTGTIHLPPLMDWEGFDD